MLIKIINRNNYIFHRNLQPVRYFSAAAAAAKKESETKFDYSKMDLYDILGAPPNADAK